MVENFPKSKQKITDFFQGTRKEIGADLLRAEDPDSPTASLMYRVLEADAAGVHGRVESASSPGTSLTTFSQEDIDNGRVVYAHRGQPNDKIALQVYDLDTARELNFDQNEASLNDLYPQVSDGIETSNTVYLPVSAFALVLRLVNNTGLMMTYRSWVFILPENLTFLSNGDDPDLEIHYEVNSRFFLKGTPIGNSENYNFLGSFLDCQAAAIRGSATSQRGRGHHFTE